MNNCHWATPILMMVGKLAFAALLFVVFFLQQEQLTCAAGGDSVRKDVINDLLDKIAKLQIKETTPYVFPITFYKQKGVYPSDIRLAFSGSPEDTILRREFKIFDNNAFVTLWVSSLLLETVRFDKTARPSDKQLLNALEAISTYHDKNFPNTSKIVFWPQTYNESEGMWTCSPLNLNKVVNMGNDFLIFAANVLKDLDLKKYSDEILEFVDTIKDAVNAFYIPADFDDTFVNIGFGSLLKNYQSVSQQPYLSWLSNNTNITSAIAALKRYAYKPFSSSLDSNAIDPRTYYYARKFLQQFVGFEEISLVSTWIDSISKSRANFNKYYRMPFNIDNVDLTVSVNVLYGLTAAVLSDMEDPKSWFDDEVQTIYLNTTSLVMYEISSNFSSRPDLALTYYPSVFNFYWFTSRVLNLLNSYDQLPYPVMQTVKEYMTTTLHGVGTEDILRRGTKQDQYVYFDDFLGVNDTNEFGEPDNHGDDRISSTSMAINALFYIWSNASDGRLGQDVPDNVQDTLVRACDWLTDEALSDKLQHMNAFFSGSVKLVPEDYPFLFPLNFIQRINGSAVSRNSSDFNDVIAAVSGLIPEDKYEELLKEPYFGYKISYDFHGYNVRGDFFPFWSSDSFTYAASALALAQCNVNNL